MQRTRLVRTHSLFCAKRASNNCPPDASGYAFAISYQSELSNVTPENLVVFTTKYKYAFISFLSDFSLTAAA